MAPRFEGFEGQMARDTSKMTFKKLIQFRKLFFCFRNAPRNLPVDLPRTRDLRGMRFANPDLFSGIALQNLNMSRVLGGQFASRLHASAFWVHFLTLFAAYISCGNSVTAVTEMGPGVAFRTSIRCAPELC